MTFLWQFHTEYVLGRKNILIVKMIIFIFMKTISVIVLLMTFIADTITLLSISSFLGSSIA